MNASEIRSAVIVGVDGSQASIHAAEWAVDEARVRGIPLRLLAVMKATHSSNDDYYRDLKHAETSVGAAQAAVEAMGLPVKVETEIRRGQPAAVLVSESHDADMLCVGSVGIGRYSRALLGSTATSVAEQAHCPVAVIRSRPDQPRKDIDWIVVAVDEASNEDLVVDQAMSEAQLRKLPVLAIGVTQRGIAGTAPDELDERLTPWRRWYPDVHVYPVATGTDVARFLHDNDDNWAPLAVISSDDADRLAQIIGSKQHPVFRHTEASVLIVRD
ncbi:universal stress protein [Mycobacterium branderi]|uniref:Universal stress protein n=1 Tax=Mycobacterium branderi TaxID=43348 RepID=A0A7I7W5F5_9MYCO|nr:universal stress protein [Mycobacterium branderi]MCV7231130.1 universal stress protein [Mycobacterium branderi]ORA35706.1 universal stress protein [Mycobacterium branderi]BBZ12749.1 universal stress protein [Mycobacterium branderi]